MKSSAQRGVRALIMEQYPELVDCIEEIIPKKSQLTLMKWCVLGGRRAPRTRAVCLRALVCWFFVLIWTDHMYDFLFFAVCVCVCVL